MTLVDVKKGRGTSTVIPALSNRAVYGLTPFSVFAKIPSLMSLPIAFLFTFPFSLFYLSASFEVSKGI